ncbi:MAG: DNA mismatch repair endonuclease MutL [Hyphomicrobiales bacterium]|nr:DNA mismatch repair endonuclease MutL [Hyphomicrobiales bacterium]
MPIRQLPPTVVNRIAAGEVVERPASVVKELVENAIDAGARWIDVVAADGGLSLIRVTDDGFGMDARDLALAVERHATSKLDHEDLLNIATLGFRGEALPSIGSVARLLVASRPRAAQDGAAIAVDAGVKSAVKPAALGPGACVEVRDLFYATPARLKFMKSERAETAAISETVKRLALARPEVGFALSTGERGGLTLSPVAPGDEHGLRERIARVLGRDFAAEAAGFDAAREGLRIHGFAGLPTLHRADAAGQFLFVNGRPVRDKLLAAATRAAYADLTPRGRHPMLALFVEIDPRDVDVNVHPAKAEVRFRDGGRVRAAIIGALRDAVARASGRTSHVVSGQALRALQASAPRPWPISGGFAEAEQTPLAPWSAEDGARAAPGRLGSALAQFHGAYILAQTVDGVVIVDQHAAHERIVYEKLKAALAEGRAPSQALLIPHVVELDDDARERALAGAQDYARLGLVLEPFGPGAVVVRETPALLGDVDVKSLVLDLASDDAGAAPLEERLHAVCAKLACYGSVRSGRRLTESEMDALLRRMEATPNAGQCNHGRPTFVALTLAEIERLFGRR